jgi:hypothetical protein
VRVLHAWVNTLNPKPEGSQQSFKKHTFGHGRWVGGQTHLSWVATRGVCVCVCVCVCLCVFGHPPTCRLLPPPPHTRRHVYAVVAGVAMRCFKTAEAHLVSCGVGGLGAGQETMLKSPI